MKRNILYFLLSVCPLLTNAQSIQPAEATRIARHFFNERARIHPSAISTDAGVLNIERVKMEQQTTIYAVNFTSGGYVLVSASAFTYPVLGYSMSGFYSGTNEPQSLKAWLRYFGRQIQYAENSGLCKPEITAARLKYQSETPLNLSIESRSVEPMLRTTWDQGNYYNDLCPADAAGPGGHCWAGCVATAVGQLMFYHRWPNQGTGEYSYIHPDYGEQYADFGATTYNWNGMQTALNSPNHHIALLLNHLGISFDMDYGPNGSGMWNHSAARSMRNFFKYGPETRYIFRDSTSLNWDSILVANLDARKPLYYAGWESVGSQNGHAFVCDGYAPDNFYHFNWGWSGSYDGYFLLSALTPGGNNFNFAQEVIKDIYPDTLHYSYPAYCSGPDTLVNISGTFSDGSNMVNYQNNSDCIWLVKPNEPDFDSITSLELNFPLVDLAGTDRIRIYQGADTTAAVISEITGTNTPATISIPGNTALVRFTTDDAENANGFLASYHSILPVYCSGTTTFTESAGIFDDGSGDYRYSNNAVCKWKITPPNPQALTLTFESFNTEPENDLLRIYDLGTQQMVASLSGESLPGPITIASGKAYLVFMTNNQITAPGWTIRWAPEETTGISDPARQPAQIFPNPVQTRLWIKPGKHQGQTAEISIIAIDGKIIRRETIFFENNREYSPVSTEGADKGLYILSISSASGTDVFRLIKN